jgi:hypothetical protein
VTIACGVPLPARGKDTADGRAPHSAPLPASRQGNRIWKKRSPRLLLSYPSPVWGGWPAVGRSGGGSHNGSLACCYPRASFARLDHPGLRFWTMLRIVQARPTLPTRGRDYSRSSYSNKRAPISYAIALPRAGRGERCGLLLLPCAIALTARAVFGSLPGPARHCRRILKRGERGVAAPLRIGTADAAVRAGANSIYGHGLREAEPVTRPAG